MNLIMMICGTIIIGIGAGVIGYNAKNDYCLLGLLLVSIGGILVGMTI